MLRSMMNHTILERPHHNPITVNGQVIGSGVFAGGRILADVVCLMYRIDTGLLVTFDEVLVSIFTGPGDVSHSRAVWDALEDVLDPQPICTLAC